MARNEEHFVKIPKDLENIKQKFILGLTKRQAISFGIGAAVGFPAFYLVYNAVGLQPACFALGAAVIPAFFCGMYKKNGMFFEQVIKLIIGFLKKPKLRTYQSENTFEIIERQIEYKKLARKLAQSESNSTKGKRR